jgi:ABC-type microcin C transport system duplicated ATPase subunit YejF
VNHPAILLADEPTGNLDSENSAAVVDVMRDLNRRLGQTIQMISRTIRRWRPLRTAPCACAMAASLDVAHSCALFGEGSDLHRYPLS